MKTKYLLLLIVVAIFHLNVNGQETIDQSLVWPTMNFRYGVANHFHRNFPSTNIGLEIFPVEQASFVIERGWVYEPHNFDGELIKGRKFNLELRYYPLESDDRVFIGGRFHSRSSTVNSRYTLGYECQPESFRNDECVFYTDFIGNIKTNFYAYQIIFGTQFPVYKVFFLEIYGALGESIHKLDRSSINGGNFVEDRRLYSEGSFSKEFYPSIKVNLIFYLKEIY